MRYHHTAIVLVALMLAPLAACRSEPAVEEQSAPETVAPAAVDAPASAEEQLTAEMLRLAATLRAGISALERGDIRRARTQASAVLNEQPDNVRARGLLDAGGPSAAAVLRIWMDDFDKAPDDAKLLMWPSRSFWRRVSDARRLAR